jgi:hypothetical protein
MEPNAMANNQGGAMNDTANAFQRMRTRGAPPNTFGAPPAPAPNTNPVGSFSATNNLIGSQINPTNSAQTNTAQGYSDKAGAAYNNFQLSPFQGVTPLNFGAERGMLGAAGTQMAGLGYNNTAANTQFGNAQSQLGGAQQNAMGYYGNAGNTLQGLQGLGGFTGGGANTADFGKAESMVTDALSGDLGQNFAYGSDVAKARGLVTPALERAMSAPDRNALAGESLSLLEERSRPGYDQTLRQVGAKNAAMGRRGSGITTNELGDVSLARERELSLARRELANDASSRTMQDNADRVNLSMGVTQGLGSEDRGAASVRQGASSLKLQGADQISGNARFNASQQENAAQRAAQGAQFGASFQRGLANDLTGIGRDVYGMGRDQSNLSMDVGDRYGQQDTARVGLGERQAGFQRNLANDSGNFTRDEYSAGVDERNAGRKDEYNQGDFARTKFSDMRGYLGDERSNDRSNRNELRGERDYQYGLSQDSLDNEFRTAGFEESLRNGRYNRGMGTTNVGFGGTSPANAYGAQADRYAGQASDAYEGAGQALAAAGSLRRRGAGGGGVG